MGADTTNRQDWESKCSQNEMKNNLERIENSMKGFCLDFIQYKMVLQSRGRGSHKVETKSC